MDNNNFKKNIDAYLKITTHWLKTHGTPLLNKALSFINITPKNLPYFIGGIFAGFIVLGFLGRAGKEGMKMVCAYVLTDSDERARGITPVSVEIVTLKPSTITQKIKTIGRLRANKDVRIKSEVATVIKSMNFKEGSRVKKGDLLIQFEDADLKAQFKRAHASFENAKIEYDRINQLQSKNYKSQSEKDKAFANMLSAEAEMEVYKARVDQHQIRAPFDGVAGLMPLHEGAYVQQGTELLSIIDSTPMIVDFKIPEKHVNEIGMGQNIIFVLDTYADETFRGVVEAVDAQIDSNSHSIALKATINNDHHKLKPGQYGEIWLMVGENDKALVVPESALFRESDIDQVWIFKQGKAFKKKVVAGPRENGQVEILAGLLPGDQVIISGQIKLQMDGMPAQIAKPVLETKDTSAPQ
jgi:membrane fusion protein (multidrug efflux system)